NQALAGLSPDTEAVNSAIAVVQSRDLADRVIDKLGLMRDPDFNSAIEPPTWFSSLLDLHTYMPAAWADGIISLLSGDAGGLTDELDKLREQVVAADQAVEDYRTKNGLVETRGDTLATQESAELGTQLVMARTDRAAAEAKLQQVQSLLNSPQGTETAGAVLQ